eukprot:316628_1
MDNTNSKIRGVPRKLYILRVTMTQESREELIMEQVAYKQNSNYPRNIRRITSKDLKEETDEMEMELLGNYLGKIQEHQQDDANDDKQEEEELGLSFEDTVER